MSQNLTNLPEIFDDLNLDENPKLSEEEEEDLNKPTSSPAGTKMKSKKKNKKSKAPSSKIKLDSNFENIISHDPANIIHTIPKSYHPDLQADVQFYLNGPLYRMMCDEVNKSLSLGESAFLPALMQLLNVACMPGLVKASIGLPDIHSGYGFAIGNVAAFDAENPKSVVSPGGVGYDINCGVRLIRTNLTLSDVRPIQEELTQALYDHLPVGVGGDGPISISIKQIDEILEAGLDWATYHGYAWPTDKLHCEEHGRMPDADPRCVSQRAKARGKTQLGTLGAGNHYAEIQAVQEIYDAEAAKVMGITFVNQICIMIHCGSRGLGHQVATDYIDKMQAVMDRDQIDVKDKQLACALISSSEGKDYIKAMSAAANFAYCNRSVLTHQTRKAFSTVLKKTPEELDMALIYDVSHNMAKWEEHEVDGQLKRLLVHRKGSTRAFPPGHPLIPLDYQKIGQPVLVGGSMGTCSYVLTGTDHGMKATFGSTCHGAGRAHSRAHIKHILPYEQVLQQLKDMGITLITANPKNVAEEAPGSYKDVSDVVDTCAAAGISKKAIKLIPIGVIKG